MKRGLVRLTKLNRLYIPYEHYVCEEYTNYTNIQVCSSNALPYFIDVSPIRLGPVITEDKSFPRCNVFENFWNWIKVYKSDLPETEEKIPAKEQLISKYFGDFEIYDYPKPLPLFWFSQNWTNPKFKML